MPSFSREEVVTLGSWRIRSWALLFHVSPAYIFICTVPWYQHLPHVPGCLENAVGHRLMEYAGIWSELGVSEHSQSETSPWLGFLLHQGSEVKMVQPITLC